MAGQLERPDTDVFVAVAGVRYASNEVVFMIDVVEVEVAEDDLVFVDANAMSDALAREGKIALYGLFFDFDKADLKAESDPTLKELAKLLKQNPTQKYYVVGHTDLVGTFAYNQQLSRDRARSVVTALVKRYGIASDRLEPHGVGPLVPVSTNTSDAGKAKNRRVELVVR